jgi:multidrug resistance efflux pump
MKKTTRKLERTAYHEAGHVVVLYRTADHPGSHVTIVPHQEENWRNLGTAFDGVSDSFSPEDMEAVILSCYAGDMRNGNLTLVVARRVARGMMHRRPSNYACMAGSIVSKSCVNDHSR